MRWSTLDIESLGWLGLAPGSVPVAPERLDPYLAWAAASGMRGFVNVTEFERSVRADARISVIARARSAAELDEMMAEAGAAKYLDIPPVYAAGNGVPGNRPLIFTGRVRLGDLWRLRVERRIDRFELGLPLVAADSTPHINLPPAGPAGAARRVPAERVVHEAAQSFIGIIDYGCAFLNGRFAGMAGPRVVSLWDQGSSRLGTQWSVPPELRYGRQLDAPSIAGLFAANRAAREDEAACYTRIGYLMNGDDPVRSHVLRDTHGTHVMDIAAGNTDPVTGEHDNAGEALLHFVQLPLQTVVDCSGGSLSVHVLDALRYLLARCPPPAKLVVNLSYGQHAGPHDGSSLLELAMDELLDQRPNDFTIVLSAGNTREAKGHWTSVLAAGQSETLEWKVSRNDRTDSFFEIWYRSADEGPAGLAIEVRTPDGEMSGRVELDSATQLRNASGQCVAALIHREHVATGDGCMALLALSPTVDPTGEGKDDTAPAGVWTVTLTATTPVDVHVYVEREDPTVGRTAPAAFLVSNSVEEGALNGIATGGLPVVVGGFRASDNTDASYSGFGPTRAGPRLARLPDVQAISDESASLQGVRAASVRSGATFRMNGTSVAAPLVVRRLYNLLAAHGTPVVRGDWPALVQAIRHAGAGVR